MNKKHLIKFISYILVLVSLYYIYHSLISSGMSWLKIVNIIQHFSIGVMFVILFLYLSVLYFGAYVWARYVQIFSGETENTLELIVVYAKSNLGKYLPGNFMQFIGRNYLGNKLGYQHSDLLFSTVYEMANVLLVGCAILVIMSILGWTEISLNHAINEAKKLNGKLTMILLEPKDDLYVESAKKIVNSTVKGKLVITDPNELAKEMLVDYIRDTL